MFDAKTRFSEIVRRVKETGQPVTVTSHGQAMVRIVPAESSESEKRLAHNEAVAAIREMWKTLPPTTREENKRDIEEGRR